MNKLNFKGGSGAARWYNCGCTSYQTSTSGLKGGDE